jgi:hypothetical protein
MSDKRTRTLDEMIGRLPSEIAPPDDLWPRIEAELARPSLDSLVRGLPTDVPPPEDLWPQIEARIQRPARARKLAFAAALAAGLAAVVIATALREQPLAPGEPDTSVARTSPSEPASDTVTPWWLWHMPAAANDVALALSRDLALVRSEREAIERAIEEHPADGRLQDLWGYAYAAERRLESEANRVMLTYERGYGI